MARVMSFMGANATVDTHQKLTYVIYWRPAGGPNGHSAMIINSSLIDATDLYTLNQSLDDQSKDNYVSWVRQGGMATVGLGAACTFLEDMGAGWGGQTIQKPGHPYDGLVVPTRWVALKGLDIHSMHLEWKHIRSKPNANWKLLDKNCATVVARVLKAGCAVVGAQGAWYYRNPLIWTPDGVMKFAKSLTNWVYATSSS
jgi:hypothetical protein